MKSNIFLFVDGSVHPQRGIGFGGYLLLNESELSSSTLERKVKTKKFENTSSTKLELETLLWALDDTNLKNFKIVVYTVILCFFISTFCLFIQDKTSPILSRIIC